MIDNKDLASEINEHIVFICLSGEMSSDSILGAQLRKEEIGFYIHEIEPTNSQAFIVDEELRSKITNSQLVIFWDIPIDEYENVIRAILEIEDSLSIAILLQLEFITVAIVNHYIQLGTYDVMITPNFYEVIQKLKSYIN